MISAIICGFLFHKILQTKLAIGQYSLRTTFWKFGVIGYLATLFGAIVIVNSADNIEIIPHYTLADLIVGSIPVPLGVYSLCIIYGIWRSSCERRIAPKIMYRFFSLLFVVLPILSVRFFWLHYLCFFGVLLYMKYTTPQLSKVIYTKKEV